MDQIDVRDPAPPVSPPSTPEPSASDAGVATVRAFLLGMLSAAVIAYLTVIHDNLPPYQWLSMNMTPVFPYMLMLAAGLLINPILRRVPWIRPFSTSELLLIFVMCAVSATTASVSLVGRLVPLVTSVSNPKLNNAQSRMDVHTIPFVNEDYFILTEGAPEEAMKIREAHLAWELAKRRRRVARDLLLAEDELARIAAERAAIDTIPQNQRMALKRKLDYAQTRTEEILTNAQDAWAEIGRGDDIKTVAEESDARIKELKNKRDTLAAAFQKHNEKATEAVVKIREGLPEGGRALPGFLYEPGEGWLSYTARRERARVGGAALKQLDAVLQSLETIEVADGPLPADLPQKLTAIADALTPITTVDGLQERYAEDSRKLDALEAELNAKREALRTLWDERRFASLGEFTRYDEQIEALKDPVAELEQQVEAMQDTFAREVTSVQDACAQVKEAQAILQAQAEKARDLTYDKLQEIRSELQGVRELFVEFDSTARRYWLGDAEWGLLLRPIGNWLVIMLLAYMVFLTFNTLVYRQWAHNEKLLYPIAELTTVMAKSGTEQPQRGPKIYTSGLFWFGFAVAAGIYGWNYMASQHIIPNISPINLTSRGHQFTGGSIFSAVDSGVYFVIIFAVIGISFLVPANISFSFWSWEIFALCIYIGMSWLGYGGGRHLGIGNGPRFNMGGGAMIVFGAVTLWTCRRYLLCAFNPGSLKDLVPDERRELRISSALFLGGLLALGLFLVLDFGAHPFYTALYLLMALIFTIAMVRAVAEGGILGLSSGFGPFDLLTKSIGTNHAWTAPSLFAPLMIFNGLLLGNFKGFIAPQMANALKVREQMRIRRWAFHAAIGVGILVAILVSVVTLIILSYEIGANNLSWMHRGANPDINGVMANPGPAHAITTKWILAGAGVMVALLFARRSLLWLPHPIGLVMLLNNKMWGFWWSIFIGWLAKSLVSKYCSEDQYLQLRNFFIGLIIGHLFAALCGWEPFEWHWG